jgi:hypothetical protein
MKIRWFWAVMVDMARDIKIPVGFSLRVSLGFDSPTAEEIKDLIFAVALPEDDDPNTEVLKGLVRAYMGLTEAEAEDDSWDDGYDILSDNNDYEAEKVYREFAIKGWRAAVGSQFPEAAKSRDDDEVYESCPWYDYGKMVWPAQLVAEVGYLAGYKAGREGVAMHNYVVNQEAQHGKDWWKKEA